MPDENNDLPSLEALERKIEKAKPKVQNDASDLNASDYSQAFRFTVELFSGVLVGSLIGYGIDRWLGTLPWAMIVCLFIGMAAGIRNMMRSAREIESKERE
jgi:ATP synthase protein I